MVFGGHQVSQEAEEKYAADVALAGKFSELLEAARAALRQQHEAAFRE